MRLRLLASYLTISVVTLVLLVVPLGRIFASRERDRLLRDIEHDATVVAGWSEDALESGRPPGLDAQLAAYARDPGGRVVIVDRAGRAVADSDTPADVGVDFSNRPEIASAIGGVRAEGSRRSDTLDADLMYVAVPVASGGTVHGAVRITYPSSTLDARVRAAWLGLAVLVALVLVTVTAVGFALARLVTGPVTRLGDAARRVARGDLSVRAPTDEGAPELRDLAVTFNETVARLQQILDAQQAFVADASHQLRTPLTALRLQLENLEPRAPLDVQSGLASARAEIARLSRIGDALLTLARSPAAAVTPEPIDVPALLDDRSARWRPVAADQDVELEVSAPAGTRVSAVPGDLDQILDNLIDNALEVAPTGSVVRVAAVPATGQVEIHVVDQGPGLDEEGRAHAFDRFWRGPEASPGGSGLGLAIVAELARRSGGRAELRAASPPGGLDAVVVLEEAAGPAAGG